MNYAELFRLLIPETIVVLTALAVLFYDVVWMRDAERSERLAGVVGIGCVGCLAPIFLMVLVPVDGSLTNCMLVMDSTARLVKISILLLTFFTLLASADLRFTRHIGEYFALILLTTVGLMLMASSEELLMMFVSLELASLSLYTLTAFNKSNPRSAEAALKYFLFGGMSAAFLLFGLSLIYGLAGSTNLRHIATALAGKGIDPLLLIAMVMVVIGFGFKVAAVPFHLWAPDTYQGAPTQSAALIASGSKVAGFFLFAKVMMFGLAGAEGSAGWHNFTSGWLPLLATVAVFSMLLGNFAALAQTSVKRLLAYSAIAHAGYALLGIMAHNQHGLASVIYYAITYGFAVIGAFSVVSIVEDQMGGDKLEHFSGLSRRSPVLALSLLVFVLSLAGIPPLAGFFGKFYVFTAAVAAEPKSLGLLWIVILAIATSAVSLYYYLQILKRAYVTEPSTAIPPVPVLWIRKVAVVLLAIIVLLLGCLPDFLLQHIAAAFPQFGQW